MYKRVSIRQKENGCYPNVPLEAFECEHRYRPMSYYLNGGNDPTGEHTDFSGQPSCDSAEDIAGGCSVDAFADPRTSFFDVVEQIGFDKASQSVASTEAGQKQEK